MFKRVFFSAALLALGAGPAAVAQTAVWTADSLGSTAVAAGVLDLDMPGPGIVWGIQRDGSPPVTLLQDMFVTADRGATWFANTIVTDSSAGKNLTNISGVDGLTAYIGGFDAAIGGGYLFKTTDGGQTFIDAPIPGVEWLNAIHFFDANTGLLLSDPSTAEYDVFRTINGGTTWTRVPAAILPNPEPGDYGLTNQFYALGDHIWFGTGKGRVYHSPDRGLTWTVGDTGFRNSGNTEALRNFAFASPLIGLVTSVDGLMKRTVDGGTTWTALTPTGPIYSSHLTGVPGTDSVFVGSSAAIDSSGTSYTTNAGMTWTLLDSSQQYLSLEFWDGRHGWAGGFTNTGGTDGIFRYTGASLGPLVPVATSSGIVREASAAYPNPTAGRVRLVGTEPRETVTVYDAAGRTVLHQLIGTTSTLDLSCQPTGLYQLVFSGGKQTRTTRVAVVR